MCGSGWGGGDNGLAIGDVPDEETVLAGVYRVPR
jgi:hypothetical protein